MTGQKGVEYPKSASTLVRLETRSGSESTIGPSCESGNLERIDVWSIEAGHCMMEQKSIMDVFDGRSAILEPTMRECGTWARETKHRQHPDCDCRTCGNTKIVKLDVETNDNVVDEKMWTSRDISDRSLYLTIPLHCLCTY